MYQQFAQVYDDLMMEVDYLGWVDYIEKIFYHLKMSPKNIIDLACGTGNITIPLAQRGYRMIGIDLSQDMLSVADQKANDFSVKVQWLCQNIKNLQGFKEREAIICACDGMNYILESEELQDIFFRVFHSLGQDGIFAFDMNSRYKIEEVLAEQTFANAGEEVAYIWENYYDKEQKIIDFELSFFVEEGEKYKRFNEFHQQKAYEIEEVLAMLKVAGFKKIQCFEAFTLDEPNFSSERVQYIAQK